MPKIIGITGTIGSGKSTVGEILAELGIPVIDTDKIVHVLLDRDSTIKHKVLNHFGEEVRAKGNTNSIDRAKLAERVFRNSRDRHDLEEIIHPAVVDEFRHQVKALHAKEPVVAILVPLLFEASLEKEFDEIWTVFTKEDVLLQRLKSRDITNHTDSQIRMSAQWPQAKKCAHADWVIDNSYDINNTKAQVQSLLSKLF